VSTIECVSPWERGYILSRNRVSDKPGVIGLRFVEL
jgi:hypothetical protein